MRSSIAVNRSFFDRQRMVSQYLLNARGPKRENIVQTETTNDVEISALFKGSGSSLHNPKEPRVFGSRRSDES